VEEAVYQEFERNLGAWAACWARWTPCTKRSKIQDESLYYESKKHDGSLPLVA